MKPLRHRTVETGHVRDTPRGEVDDDVLFALAPKMRRALRGETVSLQPSAWWLTASEHAGRLDAQLWYGPTGAPFNGQPPGGEPHVRLTVLEADRELTASMAGVAALPTMDRAAAAMTAGDLERCLAWCWLELRAQ